MIKGLNNRFFVDYEKRYSIDNFKRRMRCMETGRRMVC